MSDLQKELKRSKKKWGNHYSIKTCLRCKKEYVAGTTSEYCLECQGERVSEKRKLRGKVPRTKILRMLKQDSCFFCNSSQNLEIHHIDKDLTNNSLQNIVRLCATCHRKLHGKIYNILLKRVFKLLINERLTYEEIGRIFGHSKQNVYNILTR